LDKDVLMSREHMDFVQGRTYFAGGQKSGAMCLCEYRKYEVSREDMDVRSDPRGDRTSGETLTSHCPKASKKPPTQQLHPTSMQSSVFNLFFILPFMLFYFYHGRVHGCTKVGQRRTQLPTWILCRDAFFRERTGRPERCR